MMKRVFDVVVSAGGLVVAAPVLAAVAVAILLRDGRPVIFRQVRVGQHARPFEILKFRTMRNDAQALGGISTAAGDPRITPLGRFLRKTSLDELPQLINVLRGDMSLVGPRPDTPQQESDYAADDWRARCSVRPGITGLAQATLRSSATPQQRLELDLRYARNPGLRQDLEILGKTLLQVFGKGGI
jgi:lipopolysaccharide/colanic/teichoic acid biosynthesis glycosyltransferase